MNTYRRVAIVITALLLAGFAVGQDEASTGMCLMYRAISPDKEEDWTSAGGVEAQLRFWQDESVAVALALGVDRWKAVHEFSDGIDELGYYAVDIDGTATLVPIGVSLVHRSTISEEASVTFDAGVRYVLVDSNIDVATTEEDEFGLITYIDPVTIDNSWLGVVGVTVEGALDEDVWVFAGLSYQFDLTDPGETFLGDSIGETSFQGPAFRLGLNWKF